jgi:uncharacterized protein (DUF1499 family)
LHNITITRLGWGAALLGATSILIVAASIWGFRADGWPWPRAYQVATLGAWAGLGGTGLALAGLGLWLLRRQKGGAAAALLGLALSLPVAGLAVAFDLAARTTPPINDISTDTEDALVFWFTVTPTDFPSANSDPQHAAYPDVRPLELTLPFDEAFGLVLALVEARDWQVLSADPAEAQIEAIATSRLFGFEDEVAIRMTKSDTGTRIDMRSRSRLGQIDRGANAARIIAFLSDLEARTRN